MLTSAGSGYSRWRDIGVTRWREDATRDDWGSYIFLRDVVSGAVWSAGYQPCGIEPDTYQVTFTEDRAEFIRKDANITTTLEVVVSPEDDAEVRRLTISNTGHRDREIEVTSYCGAGACAAGGRLRPINASRSSSCRRSTSRNTRRFSPHAENARPRSWTSGRLIMRSSKARCRVSRKSRRIERASSDAGVRSDRRLRSRMDDACRIRWERSSTPCSHFDIESGCRPARPCRIAFWTGVAASREAALDLLDKHHEANSFVRAATLAWTQAQVQLRHLGIDSAEAVLFQRLAGHLLYADGSMRPPSHAIRDGSGPPMGLWSQRISGDVPIVLLRIDAVEDIAVVRQLLQAHEYWQMKGLAADLVILNERAASYVQDLQNALETQVRMSQSRPHADSHAVRGSVFMLRADLISEQTHALLSAVARVVLVARRGGLADQLDRVRKPPSTSRAPGRSAPKLEAPAAPAPARELEFFNGLGGFDRQGREYVTLLPPGQSTPAPVDQCHRESAFWISSCRRRRRLHLGPQ